MRPRELLFVAVAAAGCGRLEFSPVSDAAPDAPAPSCLSAPRTTLAYQTRDFADFSSTWATGGNGSWSVTNGQLVQADQTVTLAFAYMDPMLTDYRVVANLHIIDASMPASGHAIELAVRIDGGNLDMYQCNWGANGALVINGTSAGVGTVEFTRVMSDVTGVDPRDVTMEAQMVGSRIECCVDGVPGATASAIDTRFTSGGVGVKTFFTNGSFDHFQVFQ